MTLHTKKVVTIITFLITFFGIFLMIKFQSIIIAGIATIAAGIGCILSQQILKQELNNK